MPAARWQTTLTEARRAPLPFALLSFSYAAYFLAALIALFAEGGVSESEEWHVFIVGWPTVPLAALAAALAVGGLKRARHADAEAFYPLLLTANALCWVGYFAYCFPPPWLYDYQIDEQALYPLLWLLPLINLLVLFAFNRGLHLLAGTKTTGLYALLPIAALYVGFNFTGYRIEDPELLDKTWWPQISSIEGRTLARAEGGILSRADDMVCVRGVNVYPTAVEAVVRRFPEVAEFRSTVSTRATLGSLRVEIELEPDAPDDTDVATRVAQAVREAMGLSVPVQVVEPLTLPRFEMKARRFVVADEPGRGQESEVRSQKD